MQTISTTQSLPRGKAGTKKYSAWRKNHFFWGSTAMLVLAVIGFSDNLFFDLGQESNSDPKFIIHGLFFLAWFVVLVIQSGFIRQGNYKAHMRWGIVGMLIGVGVVLSTFYVFVAVYKGWSVMPFYVKANRFYTVTFAVLLWLAWRNRKNGVKHKRYLYMGTLYTLGPVLDRVAPKIGIDSFWGTVWMEVLIWNTLFLGLFLYDWRTLKRIHPISWIGVLWFYIVLTLVQVL
ncbi:hypothetical protein MD537_05975 [Flavihumibacter sediminis]|nr:hypothetical protein [Flavihumibacter sediminis]